MKQGTQILWSKLLLGVVFSFVKAWFFLAVPYSAFVRIILGFPTDSVANLGGVAACLAFGTIWFRNNQDNEKRDFEEASEH